MGEDAAKGGGAPRRRLRHLVWAAPVVLVLPGLTDRPARWLVIEDAPGAVDAAIVLAGDRDFERTDAAAAMVLSGEASLLVLTGGELGPGNHARELRDRAVALGVEPRKIRLEERSSGTREALLAVLPIFREEGVLRVALVTSPYHQRRAYLAARRLFDGITLLNRPARPSAWSPEGWWWRSQARSAVLQEYLKLSYYWCRGWV